MGEPHNRMTRWISPAFAAKCYTKMSVKLRGDIKVLFTRFVQLPSSGYGVGVVAVHPSGTSGISSSKTTWYSPKSVVVCYSLLKIRSVSMPLRAISLLISSSLYSRPLKENVVFLPCLARSLCVRTTHTQSLRLVFFLCIGR